MSKKDRASSSKAIARLLTKQARKIRREARSKDVDLELIKRTLRRSLKAVKKAQ